MAAAPPSPLASSVEKTNGAKLSRLLIDGGTMVLRNVFDSYHPPANLAAGLKANLSTLKKLLKKNVLRVAQWDQLFPPGGATPDSKTFDITLLFLLLTNICGLPPPLSGWHKPPPSSDTSLEANLARVKLFRNKLYGHVSSTGVQTAAFNVKWQEISAVLVALGLNPTEVIRLKSEPCGEDYISALIEWVKRDEEIQSQLREVLQTQQEARQMQEEDHKTLQDTHKAVEDVVRAQQEEHQKQQKARQIQEEDHKTLQDTHKAVEGVVQIQEDTHKVVEGVLKSQQEEHQKQQKARQIQEEDHRTLQDTHKAVAEAHVAIQEVVKTQKKDHETLQQVKKTVENMTERSNRNNEEDKILSKLAKINTQKVIEYHAQRYQEGTRVSFFESIEKWLEDRGSSNRVMVISGNAGMGKSVISAVVCKRMQEAGRLSGSHFCQHNRVRYRNAKIMLQSLAFQLSDFLPEYKRVLLKTLSQNLGEELNNMEVKDLFELLFEEPLSEVKDPGRNTFMLIDGLDESEYQGRNELLDVIVNHFTKLPCWIRFLVTTRPEINIADSLKSFNPLQLESNDEENLMDIRLLFEKRLSDVIQQNHKEVILAELVRKSEGLILYAHLLTDFIKENVSLITLEHLGNTLPSGISSVYLTYFKRLETELRKELKIEEEQVLTVLSALAAAREPLQQDFVCEMMLSGKRSLADKREVMKAIACISTLLPVRDECIHFFHKSVKYWLTDISVYGQHNFTVDINEGHKILSRLCAFELEDVRRKGVSDLMFSDTTKYALQHGVGHMLELDDETRGCSLEEVAKKYVIDLEIVYSKLCVNSATAAEDIERLQNLESFPVLSHESDLNTLLFLLRKYHSAFTKRPGTFFQTVLNEGGTVLSAEASKLLQDKHPEIACMEYLYKDVYEDAAQAIFSCSSLVACFDVSPQLDYLVCECIDATIYLWSLRTGNLQWVRPAKVEKHYCDENETYRTTSPVFSCYRSVVFHPTEKVVLPGILSHAYSINGDLKPLFPESKCKFIVCSIWNSGNEATIMTNYYDDPKCIIMWSLEDGSDITRITRNEDILSFACSRDGKMIAISHCSGSICLVDVTEGSGTLAQVAITSKVCGMIKFSPNDQYIFCFHETPPENNSLRDRYAFKLKITRCNNGTFSLDVLGDKVSYKPLEHESCSEPGFLSGDPFSWIFERVVSDDFCLAERAFVFVLSEQCVLRTLPANSSIVMFTATELRGHTSSYIRRPKFRADNVAFTQNGEILYVVATEPTLQRGDGVSQTRLDLTERLLTVMAWNVSSGYLIAEKRIHSGKSKRIVPVKEGVLLTTRNDCPELWNSKLSECIRRWPNVLEVTYMMPISEEQVACVRKGNEVIILDTNSANIIATIPFSCMNYEYASHTLGREPVTCNSRCQLLCQLLSDDYHSVQLWDGTDIRWEHRWPHSLKCSYILPGMFSPTEEFVVISALTSEGDQGVYLLDAQSGKRCRMLCRGTYFFGGNFVSDEECLINSQDASGDYLLQLFNIKSGDLLGIMVQQFRTFCLATCPLKRLVAIDVIANDDSKRIFQVIQVTLPRDKDNKKKNKGLVNPPENPTKEKNESLLITKRRGLDTLDETGSKQAAVEVDQLEDAIRTSTVKFEAEHDECVRVLPYKDKDGQLVVGLYVCPDKSGIPKELEAAAHEYFGEMDVNLEWFDLYNKPSRVLYNVLPLEYPSGKPNRLDAENVDKITEIISRNLDIFSKHRNITAVQPSFKVTNSSQTANSCIAVYVLGKGRIPLGESKVPPTVDGCLLDIVDGFWVEAGSPWMPNKAQEQFEVLPWGISIGVEGVEASATLGGVVKDERNPGVLYALSCDHVLNKGTGQREIIHPGLIDYQNKIRFLLKTYIDRSARLIPGPETVSDLCETDEFEMKLEEVIRINRENLRLLEFDRTIPSEITSDPKLLKRYGYFFPGDEETRRKRLSALRDKLPQLSLLVNDIQQCLEKKPRIVAKYTTGKRGNVERGEGTYFIDAAIAELSPDEANKLQSTEQTVINGTEYYPSGTCRLATTRAILNATKLCKSGRTTEYTESTEGVCTSQNTPTYLKTKFVYCDNKVLPTAEMKYYYCESCNETVRCNLDDEEPHACSGCPTGKGKNYEIKFLPNVLCIPSERRTPFADTGDSGSVIFEIDENYQAYDRLSGFGLLFGVFDGAYGTCALASPLQIVLEELSRQVSDSSKLRLVSDYY